MIRSIGKHLLYSLIVTLIVKNFAIYRQVLRAEKKKERAIRQMKKVIQKSAPLLRDGVFRCEKKTNIRYLIVFSFCGKVFFIDWK